MIVRCREMKLHIQRPAEEVKIDVAIFVTVLTLNYLHKFRQRISV